MVRATFDMSPGSTAAADVAAVDGNGIGRCNAASAV